MVLFTVGAAGNVAVLTCTAFASKSAIKGADNVLVYVRALCLADLLCLLTVPMSVLDMITGSWGIGRLLCRFYW